MKNLIRAEEVLLFVFGTYLFSLLPYAWWWFPLLLFLPDLGMLGYLGGNRTGAFFYNLFHHRGLAVGIVLLGVFLSLPLCQLAGVIIFSHVALDRALGYGLKYSKGFRFTHLGEIGKENG
jgi:hypothetical protein